MEIRLWERHDELTSSIETAAQRHETLRRVFVEVDDGSQVGFGEVTPLEQPVNGDPGCEDVISALTTTALSRVADVAEREGRLPSWSRVHTFSGDERAERVAFAAIEMAILDLELRREGRALAAEWSVDPEGVPRACTISAIAPRFGWTPPVWATRVRVKVSGPPDRTTVAWVAEFDREILIDFNGAAASEDDVMATVAAFEGVPIAAVEQPFAPGDFARVSLLAAQLSVALSLDESVRSVSDIRLIARHGAAELVCIKPPRLGGIALARSALREAESLGLRAYVGGFFESPLGRAVNAAIAAGAPVDPSDVGPVEASSTDVVVPTGIGVRPDLRSARALGSQSWR